MFILRKFVNTAVISLFTFLYFYVTASDFEEFVMDCKYSQATHDFKNSTPKSPELCVHLDVFRSTVAHRSSRLASCRRASHGRTVNLALELFQDPHPVMTMERKEGFHDARDGECVIFLSDRGGQVLTGCRRPAEYIRSLYSI